MKTGIELITDERSKQIEKLGVTVKNDAEFNHNGQLAHAAAILSYHDIEDCYARHEAPEGWNLERWQKMHDKTHKERLVIAGALIAAELDRLEYLEQTSNHTDQ